MDTMMKLNPIETGRISISCRPNPNWVRIICLALVYTLICWLAFGLFCSVMDGALGFWSALVTPLSLIFVVMCFFMNVGYVRRKDAQPSGCCPE